MKRKVTLIFVVLVIALVAVAPVAAQGNSGKGGDDGDSCHPQAAKIAEQFGAEFEEVNEWFCEGYKVNEVRQAYAMAAATGEEDVAVIFEKIDEGMNLNELREEFDVAPNAGKGAFCKEGDKVHPQVGKLVEAYGDVEGFEELTEETLAELMCAGYGVGTLKQALATLSVAEGYTLEEILDMRGEMGWGQVWAELEIRNPHGGAEKSVTDKDVDDDDDDGEDDGEDDGDAEEDGELPAFCEDIDDLDDIDFDLVSHPQIDRLLERYGEDDDDDEDVNDELLTSIVTAVCNEDMPAGFGEVKRALAFVSIYGEEYGITLESLLQMLLEDEKGWGEIKALILTLDEEGSDSDQ